MKILGWREHVALFPSVSDFSHALQALNTGCELRLGVGVCMSFTAKHQTMFFDAPHLGDIFPWRWILEKASVATRPESSREM
jgi:hypothetical protein